MVFLVLMQSGRVVANGLMAKGINFSLQSVLRGDLAVQWPLLQGRVLHRKERFGRLGGYSARAL